MVHRLPAWSANWGKRLVKTPKLHLVDTGLACHLIGADAQRLSADRPLLGRLLETFVVGELRKQVSWTDPQTTLYHFRTATGSEADVVMEKADGTVAATPMNGSRTRQNVKPTTRRSGSGASRRAAHRTSRRK